MPENSPADQLADVLQRVRALEDACDALVADVRLRNAHRVTDLAGTVQVGTDALQAVHRALRAEL